MDLTGQHLGKYELLERVGQGGMAYVYKAHQPTVDRYVAVKVLHSHLAEDGKFVERFKREAKGLGRLRHPHIVNVIDFDVDDGWYYMVMDFIEGETLEAVLDRRGRLPVDEALRLTAQLAGALDYAHSHGRIHRDIKPSNVMFVDDAQQHAVITDFGLTRLLDNATITLSGTIAGTPAYMSPEAAQGEKVDGRADIYSLGVILYEMVTGQRPYEGETPLSVIMKVVLEPLSPALSINPALPPVVGDILAKATTKEPDERYQTAAAFQQALQEALEGPGLEVGERGAGPQAETVVLGEGQTEILSPAEAPRVAGEEAAPGRAKVAPSISSRRLPLVFGVGVLIVVLVVGFVVLNGERGVAAEDTPAAPTVAVVVEGTPETVVAVEEAPETVVAVVLEDTPLPTETPRPQPAGTLSFAAPGEDNQRQYTLSLNGVPAPPAGFNYVLWFDVAGRTAPHEAAEVTAQDGRINKVDVLANELAASVSGVRISLEPEFDDDPTISADVVYTGTVEAGSGLAEIQMFAMGGQP